MPISEVFRTFEKTRIYFKSDVFAAVAHPCGPVTGPGVPWGSSSDKLLQVQSSQKSFVILTFRHEDKLACVAAIYAG